MLSRSLTATILFAACLAGCAQGDTPIRPACPPASSSEYFFPRGSLGDRDEFRRQWYSKNLTPTGEPSLSCGIPTAEETYRFTWLHTYGPPTVIRFTRAGTKMIMHSRVLSGAAGYNPGKLSQSADIDISSEDWARLDTAIQTKKFWVLPSWEEVNGADGSQWIIEGQKNRRYHVVDRWSPKEGPVRELGVLMMQLSKLPIPADGLR